MGQGGTYRHTCDTPDGNHLCEKSGAAGFSYNVFVVEAKHQRAGRVVSGLFDMGATSTSDSFNLNRLSFVSARDLDSSDRQSAFVSFHP